MTSCGLVHSRRAALGQFERDLIQERTRAGLAARAWRGFPNGRTFTLRTDPAPAAGRPTFPANSRSAQSTFAFGQHDLAARSPSLPSQVAQLTITPIMRVAEQCCGSHRVVAAASGAAEAGLTASRSVTGSRDQAGDDG